MKNNQLYYTRFIREARDFAHKLLEGPVLSNEYEIGHVLSDALSSLEREIMAANELPWTNYAGGENYCVKCFKPFAPAVAELIASSRSHSNSKSGELMSFKCEAETEREACELAKLRYPDAEIVGVKPL